MACLWAVECDGMPVGCVTVVAYLGSAGCCQVPDQLSRVSVTVMWSMDSKDVTTRS